VRLGRDRNLILAGGQVRGERKTVRREPDHFLPYRLWIANALRYHRLNCIIPTKASDQA
jgi:hypothetical protein